MLLNQQQVSLLTKVAKAISPDAELDTETGVIQFGSSAFVPVKPTASDPADLGKVKATFDLSGLDSTMFDFVQFMVRVRTPSKEHGTVPGNFPDQLAVIEKTGRYSGIHQLDLVLDNPYITVTEVKNGIKESMK